MVDLAALRRHVRARRRALSADTAERQRLSEAAAATVLRWLDGQRGITHIATFLSLPEEIDTAPLNRALWQAGYALHLPYVGGADAPLLWLPYTPDTPLAPDSAGIPAPVGPHPPDAPELHAVITPLVAWDAYGTRLGMGGGFYDRTFRSRMPRAMPWLIGFAYPCQQVAHLPRRAWDIPLDAVAATHTLYTYPQEQT